MIFKASKNTSIPLPKRAHGNMPWVVDNTAVLIIHGIGDQLPLETLDSFARGLVTEFEDTHAPGSIKLKHVLEPKQGGSGTWFDNVLRIQKDGHDTYIDIYEYYWANYTQDKASIGDVQKWVHGVANGAKKFYKTNEELGKEYNDHSIFFRKDGHMRIWLYRLVLWVLTILIPAITWVVKAILKVISTIPIIGVWAKDIIVDLENNMVLNFDNVIGDIVVYNVTDPKSKFYSVKRQIMDGAVSAVKYLVEKTETDANLTDQLAYPSVIIAGHSLGTQVGYDAINKINLLTNQGDLKNYDNTGKCTIGNAKGNLVSRQLKGFITFGSPLDKIAFFLREMVPDTLWIRQQILDNYHGFKQQDWSKLGDLNRYPSSFLTVENSLSRLFEDIPWKNYYDANDPVSGGLDYYKNLTNVNCNFEGKLGGIFTHSSYWECPDFYRDIIVSYLGPEQTTDIETLK